MYVCAAFEAKNVWCKLTISKVMQQHLCEVERERICVLATWKFYSKGIRALDFAVVHTHSPVSGIKLKHEGDVTKTKSPFGHLDMQHYLSWPHRQYLISKHETNETYFGILSSVIYYLYKNDKTLECGINLDIARQTNIKACKESDARSDVKVSLHESSYINFDFTLSFWSF